MISSTFSVSSFFFYYSASIFPSSSFFSSSCLISYLIDSDLSSDYCITYSFEVGLSIIWSSSPDFILSTGTRSTFELSIVLSKGCLTTYYSGILPSKFSVSPICITLSSSADFLISVFKRSSSGIIDLFSWDEELGSSP